MASNCAGKDAMDSGSSEGDGAETTVEIKIKTLDSQTYTLRVDKCVPVPALKEQIATVTGVLSDQQRLICRGKVLKDDQLLSAYHVEDGHTLHLVARQPINPSLANPDHTATDPTASTEQGVGNQAAPRVMIGTFNISDQGDGGLPDFSRIVSAVLGSFGISNTGTGVEPVDLQEHISERLSRIPGLNVRSSTGQQSEDASERGQANTQNAASPLPSDNSMESLQPPVIPDSLTTLSQYMRRLREEFNINVRNQGNNPQVQDSNASRNSAVGQGGFPTAEVLGEVTQSTRQLLIEQAGECLTQLTRQLSDQANITDPVARSRIQSNALRSGALLQNLGAFLLELGRTTMTLRMGQAPTDAVVNAGPAVFISTSGPNPIMVQPLPFQPGTSFGATPVGSGANFSVGSGLRPRNIDIRIRTGSLLSSAVVNNQREASGGERSATDPPPSVGGISNPPATLRNLPPTRVVPITISALPPPQSSRSSMGILYPVLARAQTVDSSNLNAIGGQTSNEGEPHNSQTRPQIVHGFADQQQPPQVPEVPGTSQMNAPSFTTEVHSGFDQLMRNLFTGEENNGNDFIVQTNSVFGNSETAQAAINSEEAPRVSDEGTFFANLLHHIMPIVTQTINGGPSSSVHVEENQDGGTSSRQPEDPSSPPTSKRQKRE